ncbi:hypothetical protein HK099_001012 [Clydaea vesicula]|uniref:Uncharacterized protein n=1 Tax=Clydaea vesicula TaxID=447962 RepID=A0AAD5U3V0_9FUNG|nr:hypothetical protein HK099_001012 [Clydaea vesicula]
MHPNNSPQLVSISYKNEQHQADPNLNQYSQNSIPNGSQGNSPWDSAPSGNVSVSLAHDDRGNSAGQQAPSFQQYDDSPPVSQIYSQNYNQQYQQHPQNSTSPQQQSQHQYPPPQQPYQPPQQQYQPPQQYPLPGDRYQPPSQQYFPPQGPPYGCQQYGAPQYYGQPQQQFGMQQQYGKPSKNNSSLIGGGLGAGALLAMAAPLMMGGGFGGKKYKKKKKKFGMMQLGMGLLAGQKMHGFRGIDGNSGSRGIDNSNPEEKPCEGPCDCCELVDENGNVIDPSASK